MWAYDNCSNCGKFTRLKPMRISVKTFMGFTLKRWYDPEGKWGTYVCGECKSRMERYYKVKDVKMDDILDDLPF